MTKQAIKKRIINAAIYLKDNWRKVFFISFVIISLVVSVIWAVLYALNINTSTMPFFFNYLCFFVGVSIGCIVLYSSSTSSKNKAEDAQSAAESALSTLAKANQKNSSLSRKLNARNSRIRELEAELAEANKKYNALQQETDEKLQTIQIENRRLQANLDNANFRLRSYLSVSSTTDTALTTESNPTNDIDEIFDIFKK